MLRTSGNKDVNEPIFLSLGSNLGDRVLHLRAALERLNSRGVKIAALSSVYETAPVDVFDQPHFLNLVGQVHTSLAPQELLETCLEIERHIGRRRDQEKGPRMIDLDILFYGQAVVRQPKLWLPHPRLYQRKFVLIPLHEIAPAFRDPVTGKTVTELLQICRDEASVEHYDNIDIFKPVAGEDRG
ncbi:MAG: 2-amino-4-hydroxy-6-hydroxymethyldihydropteridine diphosphokinase [Acidobacteriota bacterium]